MQHPSFSNRLAETTRIATGAAQTALSHFYARRELDISVKSPGQAVTDADLAVETQIRTAMGRSFPGEAILGEEFGGQSLPTCWTLDPIDGTANFLNGLPLWGVAIGHLTDGLPDLGVIVLPLLNMVISAKNEALFVNKEPFQRTPPAIPTVSLGQPNPKTEDETRKLDAAFRAAGFGVYQWRCSAVSMAWAGMGHISGHLHRDTKLWDVVPGAAICRAASLEVEMGHDRDEALWVKAGDPGVLAQCRDLWHSQRIEGA